MWAKCHKASSTAVSLSDTLTTEKWHQGGLVLVYLCFSTGTYFQPCRLGLWAEEGMLQISANIDPRPETTLSILSRNKH